MLHQRWKENEFRTLEWRADAKYLVYHRSQLSQREGVDSYIQEIRVHEVNVSKLQSIRTVSTDCRAGVVGSMPSIIELTGRSGPGPMGVSHRLQRGGVVKCSWLWQIWRCQHYLTFLRSGITKRCLFPQDQCFPNFNVHMNSWRFCESAESDSVRLGWGLIFCSFNKFIGDIGGASSDHSLSFKAVGLRL